MLFFPSVPSFSLPLAISLLASDLAVPLPSGANAHHVLRHLNKDIPASLLRSLSRLRPRNALPCTLVRRTIGTPRSLAVRTLNRCSCSLQVANLRLDLLRMRLSDVEAALEAGAD